MRRLLLCVVLLVLTTPVLRPPVVAADDALAGMYTCEGVNPAGRPYRGVVQIVTVGEIVHLRWTFERDDEQVGFGFISHGLLVVTAYGAGSMSVVTYTLVPGQPLVGQWVMYGADGIYTETLTRMPADHPPMQAPTPQRGNKRPSGREQRL